MAEPIDTFNYGMIGAHGDSVVMLRAPLKLARMTKDQALNVAAYLFLMSGATREEFERVITAIENA